MSHSLAVPSRIKRAAARRAKHLPVAPTMARETVVAPKLKFTPAETRLIRKLRQESKAGFAELQTVLNEIKKLLS